MRRKQLYLDEDLDDELRRTAAESGLSEAEHIRRALRKYFGSSAAKSKGDPLLDLIGMVPDDSAPEDLAGELDHYAYGVPKGRKGQS